MSMKKITKYAYGLDLDSSATIESGILKPLLAMPCSTLWSENFMKGKTTLENPLGLEIMFYVRDLDGFFEYRTGLN